MPIATISTFLHTVTPKLTSVTTKYIGNLPDPIQMSVESFKLIARTGFKLLSSEPKIDPHDPKIEPRDPKINRHLV